MRTYIVTLFNMGNPSERIEEEYEANSCEDAENKAEFKHLHEGWGTLESHPVLKAGDKVKWNNPNIEDIEPENREWAKNRTFTIYEIDEGTNRITLREVGGYSIEHAWPSELELVEEETPLFVQANITKHDIARAEEVLIDNGIDEDEAQVVLQAIGYTLLNTELYGNEKSVQLHNAK